MAAPPAAIGGNHHLGSSVVDAVEKGLGTKATEDDRVDRTNSGAGKHRSSELRDHRHVDAHPIPLLDSEFLKSICEFGDFVLEFGISDPSDVSRFTFPQYCGLVCPRTSCVAIDAVVASIELSPEEPLCVRQIPFECLRVGAKPIQLLGPAFPISHWILCGSFINRGIGGIRLGDKFGGGSKCSLFF